MQQKNHSCRIIIFRSMSDPDHSWSLRYIHLTDSLKEVFGGDSEVSLESTEDYEYLLHILHSMPTGEIIEIPVVVLPGFGCTGKFWLELKNSEVHGVIIE